MTGFHRFSSSICRHESDISITVQLKQLNTASKHTLYRCTSLPACGITDTHRVLSNGTHFSAWRIMAVLAADFICIAAQHQMIRWLTGSYTNSSMLLHARQYYDLGRFLQNRTTMPRDLSRVILSSLVQQACTITHKKCSSISHKCNICTILSLCSINFWWKNFNHLLLMV